MEVVSHKLVTATPGDLTPRLCLDCRMLIESPEWFEVYTPSGVRSYRHVERCVISEPITTAEARLRQTK